MVNDYTGFKVLLDDPAEIPGLGYRGYAHALAEIIEHSKAEFAIGVFGSWGSGKTTLMRDIERQFAGRPDIVPVWFTAWRYEKEPHLIVPLLDVLREELDRRAVATQEQEGPARRAARAVARAGRAFLAGLSVTANVPGMNAQWDAGKVITALKTDPRDGTESLSFYQAGFVMLRDAIREFSADGLRRVVVFVDDLDRCLPSNALDLLESMKLFFDVEGCVFVVGLDQEIAERAVELKYRSTAGADATRSPVSGTDYVKKIFQVPFALPRISTDQLQEYLTTVADNAKMTGEQRTDFDDNVRRHLEFLSSEDSVNPREVKRLINTYTLQLKMLSLRLGPRLDPNIVLALQCMSFRPEWRDLYDHLAADPQEFQATLRDVADSEDPPAAVWLSGTQVDVPSEILRYLRRRARPLLDAPDLRSYVSAAEATRSTDPSLLEAQAAVNRARQAVHALANGEVVAGDVANRLVSAANRLSEGAGKRVRGSLRFEQNVGAFGTLARELTTVDGAEDLARWERRITQTLTALDTELREMRRQANVGAYS